MAERHFVNGGGALSWSLTANWSLTEGGAGGQAVPTAAEDVFFDAGSPACTVNTVNRVCKTFTASAYAATLTFTYNISVSGNITVGQNMGWSGAGRLIMLVAGTWTSNGATIGVNIGIGNFTSGTVTLADALTTSGDLLLSNATSTTFSGDFHITAATCSTDGSQTITLVHDVTISGLTTISSGTVIDGAFNWNTGGLACTSYSVTGTATIVLTGGTWSGGAGKSVSNDLTIAGDVTVSGSVEFAASGTPTLTYVSGIVTTTGSTLKILSACTLDTNGMIWNNITVNDAMTITINSLFSATGTLSLPNAAVTFDGTAGFTVGTLTHVTMTGAQIFTFKEAVTYTITTAWSQLNTTYTCTITSAHAATRAIITLGYGATQDIIKINPTRIDSSLGQCVFCYKATITDCYNWSDDLVMDVSYPMLEANPSPLPG